VDRVFYSWQSDLPNATNRSFIEAALERASKAIRKDESIELEPVIDRDTAGVSGAPDISATIFSKIERATVFVGDVSIIGKAARRPTPNPNVLIELGYAKKALGADRVLMVMNTAFGGPETLPFDLRMRRVVTYDMPEKATDRSEERRRLESRLESELRTLFAGIATGRAEMASLAASQSLEQALISGSAAQGPLARKLVEQISAELEAIKPDLAVATITEAYERLSAALPRTVAIVARFAQAADSIANHAAVNAALSLYRGLSGILNGYNTPPGFSGQFYDEQFDYHRFLGHEMMVTLLSPLVRDERWNIIAEMLSNDIAVLNGRGGQAGTVSFEYASSPVRTLIRAKEVLGLGRASVQHDLLHERHTRTELSNVVPIREFMDADYFLFLRSVIAPSHTPQYAAWSAWSCLTMRQPPQFLLNATRVKAAEALLQPLGVADIPSLRAFLKERAWIIKNTFGGKAWYHPLEDFDVTSIGSRP
jgi:hypothetical protein